MLIKAEQSLLLVIDIQEKLLPAIHGKEDILRHNIWLADIAKILSVPILGTLQYPAGLGGFVPEIASRIDADKTTEKTIFSAVADGALETMPEFSKRQIIITGIEAHVCVLQTAMDLLLNHGKEVFIVKEAVGSRDPEDKALALERLREAGCQIVSREMVIFEWMRQSGTSHFKKISKEFLR